MVIVVDSYMVWARSFRTEGPKIPDPFLILALLQNTSVTLGKSLKLLVHFMLNSLQASLTMSPKGIFVEVSK